MIDDRQLAEYRSQLQSVNRLAQANQAAFFSTLDLTNPVVVRDVLLEYVPQLVATFAPVAATVAATWYEGARRQQIAADFTALVIDPTNEAQVASTVRYAAGHLFGPTPTAALGVLGGAVQRYVTGAARATITQNTARDPAKPRYARVPVGKTCAWCTLLASRGFVYASEESAGWLAHFHDNDDCQIIPDWSDDPRVAGYEPAHLYDLYRSARDASGETDDAGIAAAIRRFHPDFVTDGVAGGS